MAERRENVNLTDHVSVEGVPGSLFVARVLEEGRSHVRVDDWSTAARSLDSLGQPILRVVGDGRDTGLFELDGVLVQVLVGAGRAYASLSHNLPARIDSALTQLKERLPVTDPASAHEVTVTFWTYGPHGPQPSWRSIAVPEWDEISQNYAGVVRASLGGLMRGFEPARGGQLILWHGRVGTGKTFALRALAWEWREWCDLHYIVDPDSFFGQHADYLMSVLLQPGYQEEVFEEVGMGAAMPFPMVASNGERRHKPWRLLILEDTGELLTPDAKTLIGQGLSRFLNVVDGLIGQGLRVLVLVTTNEPVRRLHPAVARPGRCAANVEFTQLDPDEASAWLRAHDLEEEVDVPASLASLYARLEGRDPAEVEQAAGFAG